MKDCHISTELLVTNNSLNSNIKVKYDNVKLLSNKDYVFKDSVNYLKHCYNCQGVSGYNSV